MSRDQAVVDTTVLSQVNPIMNLSKRQKLATLIAVLAALGLVAVILHWPRQSAPLPSVYFYDLGTNQVYIEPAGTTPPVKAPSGKMGVIAVMFSCGSCQDSNERFIGYLEMETPSYKQLASGSEAISPEQSRRGILYRNVDSEGWFERESEQGRKLFAELSARCPEGMLRVCAP